jgi:hypothetical protein
MNNVSRHITSRFGWDIQSDYKCYLHITTYLSKKKSKLCTAIKFDCHLPDYNVSPTGVSAHAKTIIDLICMSTVSQASPTRIFISSRFQAWEGRFRHSLLNIPHPPPPKKKCNRVRDGLAEEDQPCCSLGPQINIRYISFLGDMFRRLSTLPTPLPPQSRWIQNSHSRYLRISRHENMIQCLE